MEIKKWELDEDALERLYWDFDDQVKKKNLSERDVFKNKVRWFVSNQINKILSVAPTFGFEHAIRFLKEGKKVARIGWNGKGMWLVLSEPIERPKSGYSSYINGSKDPIPTLPFIVMKTATNEFVPWLASQTDMLAEDWMVLE